MPALSLPDPPLSDGDILLRAWTPSDVPAVTAACQDPDIPRWTHVPAQYTEHHAREFIAGCHGAVAEGRQLALAIVAADGSELRGAAGLSEVDWVNRKAEIGYWVAAEARGRGVATRAVRLLSRWTLEELRFERVELLANPGNELSQKVAEGAGFTREGVLRRYRRRHGVPEDLIMFSLLGVDLG
ncbi:MAG TPA: GNAT family N-acetyltransferase [Thermoleophilaceae bacterium]|nr:GNAT family N-acetyltransferase [Thermoleophilaceae bacterium]